MAGKSKSVRASILDALLTLILPASAEQRAAIAEPPTPKSSKPRHPLYSSMKKDWDRTADYWSKEGRAAFKVLFDYIHQKEPDYSWDGFYEAEKPKTQKLVPGAFCLVQTEYKEDLPAIITHTIHQHALSLFSNVGKVAFTSIKSVPSDDEIRAALSTIDTTSLRTLLAEPHFRPISEALFS